jgi:hypothetical protein
VYRACCWVPTCVIFAGGYDWVSLLPFFEKLETRN